MNRVYRAALAGCLVCSCIAADLGSKALVRETLADAPAQYYLDGWLRLSHWENAGTAMSLGDELPRSLRYLVFTVAAASFAVGLIGFMLIKAAIRPAQLMAGALIAGGTLSNVFDRLLHDGRALDFINIVATPLHLMIFNLADLAIALGAVLPAISSLHRLMERKGA
ncbi:MAG: signal peptidase II [Gammaproteobacteria bacterium]